MYDHVVRLIQRAREHHLPMQRDALGLERHDIQRVMVIDDHHLPVHGNGLGVMAVYALQHATAKREMLLQPLAITMLLVGSVVGALFAFALYAIAVMSLPMLCDKDVDFITAIIVSLGAIRSNKAVMVGWTRPVSSMARLCR